jgi:hypothetical protein
MAGQSWAKEAAVAIPADDSGSETRIGRLELQEGSGGVAVGFCPSPGLTYLDFGGGGER